MRDPVSNIKKKQKESLLLREISSLFFEAAQDYPALQNLFISRVTLSDDKGHCTVLFFSPRGREFFNEQLPTLKTFKPSLRKALSQRVPGRRTPEVVFKFDEQKDKVESIERLLDQIKDENS